MVADWDCIVRKLVRMEMAVLSPGHRGQRQDARRVPSCTGFQFCCSSRAEASTRSAAAICTNEQKLVAVLRNVPFSDSLFIGAPPAQTEKYSQLVRQASTPASISRCIAASQRLSRICSIESVLILPIRKSL